MTITTTNGERFRDYEQRALARLLFKRFGKDEDTFVAAWARLHETVGVDRVAILQLLQDGRGQERRYLKDDLLRDGVMETREFREDLLDAHSCQILRRHLRRLDDKADQKARSLVRRQPWKYL